MRKTLEYFTLSELPDGDKILAILSESDTVSFGDDGRVFVTVSQIDAEIDSCDVPPYSDLTGWYGWCLANDSTEDIWIELA